MWDLDVQNQNLLNIIDPFGVIGRLNKIKFLMPAFFCDRYYCVFSILSLNVNLFPKNNRLLWVSHTWGVPCLCPSPLLHQGGHGWWWHSLFKADLVQGPRCYPRNTFGLIEIIIFPEWLLDPCRDSKTMKQKAQAQDVENTWLLHHRHPVPNAHPDFLHGLVWSMAAPHKVCLTRPLIRTWPYSIS